MRQQILKTPDGVLLAWHMDFDFGRSEAELMNAAMTAINNIAVFRGYCTPYGLSHGISKREIGRVVDDCLALKIIIDLHNIEKHPATPGNMSRLNPRLQRVSQAPYFVEGKGSIEFNPSTGETKLVGDVKVIVVGSIVDAKTSAQIAELGPMLDEGLAAWEAFLTKHHIV
jgi:hypothetical protein